MTCIGGSIVNTLVKITVGRSRPEIDEPAVEAFGKSFPSGHSMSSLICYGALLIVFAPLMSARVRRAATAFVVVLVLAIGGSRLVLGGYVLGTAWLLGSVAAFETWRTDRGRRRTEPLVEGVEPEETKELASTS